MSESLVGENTQVAAPAGAPATRRPRTWLRFSLARLMMVTLLILLAVSHLRASRELHEARRELARFRREHGIVDVADRTKVHVLAVTGTEFRNWKWHVYWPEGRLCRLSASSRVAPRRGLPSRDLVALSETFQPPTQFSLGAKVETDLEGRPVIVIDGPFGVVRHVIPESDRAWLDRGANANWSQTGSMGTDFYSPTEPVILVHLQYMPGPGISRTATYSEEFNGASDESRTAAGLAIWLDVPTAPPSSSE